MADNICDTSVAAASISNRNASMVEKQQAIETLINMLDFDVSVANEAVDAVGPDVTACYNYILGQALAETEYNIDEKDHSSPRDNPDSSRKSVSRDIGDFQKRPPKKQRSISSLNSSQYTNSISTQSLGEDPSSVDSFDDDFDPPESNIRSFPILLDDDEEDEEQIQYPFTLPKSLEEVAEFMKSDKCRNVVILAGAGMSVISGIPDFRSSNGLYATMDPNTLTATQSESDIIQMDASMVLDNRLFLQNQLPCLEVNRQFLLGTKDQIWKATLAHRFVELLHKKTGKLTRLYTQNIDGLEDQCNDLPRDKVVNVHGSMDQAECGMCRNKADFDKFCHDVRTCIKDINGTDPTAPKESRHIPCHICGYNTLKPAIVLFKSNLPQRFFELVPQDIDDVDLLLVLGTSLKVAPANSLVYRVPKTCMRVIVNRDPVGISLGMQYGDFAERDYFASGDIDPILLELMGHLGWLDDLKYLLDGDKLPESSAELLRKKLSAKQNLNEEENDR
jgi:NAD-dependent deacetylase sirtuin 2